MLNRRTMVCSRVRPSKFLFLVGLIVCLGLPAGAFASEGSTDLTTGISPLGSNDFIGSLPYSNQWTYEQTASFLYLSYNTTSMAQSALNVDRYQSSFDSKSYAYPSIDYFVHLLSLAPVDSKSWTRDVSFWGRYSLGFAERQGSLSDSEVQLSSLESTSLLIFSARVGLNVSYDRIKWIKPYLGADVAPYFYRATASLTGAEAQGSAICVDPTIGAHFPVLFQGKASLYGEFRRTIALQSGKQLLDSANNFNAGLGLTF
jgi:hypothetical protein